MNEEESHESSFTSSELRARVSTATVEESRPASATDQKKNVQKRKSDAGVLFRRHVTAAGVKNGRRAHAFEFRAALDPTGGLDEGVGRRENGRKRRERITPAIRHLAARQSYFDNLRQRRAGAGIGELIDPHCKMAAQTASDFEFILQSTGTWNKPHAQMRRFQRNTPCP